MAFDNSVDRFGIFPRDSVHPDPVVSRSDGDDCHQNLIRRDLLLYEYSVDHLMQRSVAAHHDYLAITATDGFDGELRSVVLVFGEYEFVIHVMISQQFRDCGQVVESAAVTGYRIDYCEPGVLGWFHRTEVEICQTQVTFLLGRCRACGRGNPRTWLPIRFRPSRRASADSRWSVRTRSYPFRDMGR